MADLRRVAVAKAKQYGVDPAVFARQIQQESGFNPHARSSAGAQGIAQFIPSTAKQYGVNVNDPVSSLDGAARLMRDALRRNGGDYKKALSEYNSGRPDGYLHISETRNYVNRILGGGTPQRATFQDFSRSASPAAPAASGTADRSQLLQEYLQLRGRPGALLGLAAGLNAPSATAPAAAAPAAAAPAPIATKAGAAGPTANFEGAKGTATFEGVKVAGWIAPILAYARKQGWKGKVNSGYRSFQEQTRIYNSGVRPAAKPGTSNHEGTDFPRGAVDVSDAQQLAQILARSPFSSKLKWAGAKDPVHFSHPHGGSY